MSKMNGAKPFHCEEVNCKKVYKSHKWLTTHMKMTHPLAGRPLTQNDYSISSRIQLDTDMTHMADMEDLLDMLPKDEAELFAETDTITFDLNQSHNLPDSLIKVVTGPLDQDDPPLTQGLTAIQKAHSVGDKTSFMTGAQALLTIATSVPACPEVSSFFLQNPTQQSSMDLTASQKIALFPLMEESADESDLEEEKEPVKEEIEPWEYQEERLELNPFYPEDEEDVIPRKSVIIYSKEKPNATEPSANVKEEDTKISCGECGKLFDSMEQGYNHMINDHTDAVFNCKICGELLRSESEVSRHVSLVHPTNGKTESNKVQDKTTIEEPYGCEVCGKIFKYSADNIVHQVETHKHFDVTDDLRQSKQTVPPYLVHLLSEQTMLLYEEIDDLKKEAQEQKNTMAEEIVTLRNQVQNLLNIYQECKKRWKTRKTENITPSETTNKPTTKEEPKKREPVTTTNSTVKKKQTNKSNIQIKCDHCDVLTSTLSEMSIHEKTVHNPQMQSIKSDEPKLKNTLLIGDSHIRSMNLKIIEKATGGKLYTPGYLGGRRGRAYCSTRDWPEAMFPASNLTERVPQLLAGKERSHMVAGHGRVSGAAPQERVYNNLILQASCNDISNLGDIGDQETQYTMAEQSSRNTLTVMEKALSVFPSLEKGVILLRPPRADVLYDLSEHANFSLRGMVEKSNLKSRITIASMEELHFDTQEKMIQVFGPNTSSRSYGIHMDGEQGKELFTHAIVSGIRSAGLNRRGQGVRREQEKEQEVSPSDVWRTIQGGKKTSLMQDRPSVITTNMFTGLN